MERLKKLSKPELVKVIDLLMRHNLNNKHFLTRILNELEHEKTNQLIGEEQAAFERYIDDCPGPHIITNADHIRAMSDEELAASPIICRTICNLIYDSGENKKYCLKDEPCSSCIRNWLKAPYKEDEE